MQYPLITMVHVPAIFHEPDQGNNEDLGGRLHANALTLHDTGLEVIDIEGDSAFAARPCHPRDAAVEMEAMRRVAHAFVENPDGVLQELVNAAVDVCGADSAGISIEKADGTDQEFYHWLATAGQYSEFFSALLPRYPSACGVCLERGRPQLFRVGQRFFDLLGIQAPLVTDGILFPWSVEGTRGTIFVIAHDRTEAFDQNDWHMMQVLADFAATGVRQQQQQKMLVEHAKASAVAAMANDLAHKINNPLQSLTNILYLAAEGLDAKDARALGQEALADLSRLSALVEKLLALPNRTT